jgi:low affinity Fe/Cu permease
MNRDAEVIADAIGKTLAFVVMKAATIALAALFVMWWWNGLTIDVPRLTFSDGVRISAIVAVLYSVAKV